MRSYVATSALYQQCYCRTPSVYCVVLPSIRWDELDYTHLGSCIGPYPVDTRQDTALLTTTLFGWAKQDKVTSLTAVWLIGLHNAIQSSTSGISRGCVVRNETKRSATCLVGLAQTHPDLFKSGPYLTARMNTTWTITNGGELLLQVAPIMATSIIDTSGRTRTKCGEVFLMLNARLPAHTSHPCVYRGQDVEHLNIH